MTVGEKIRLARLEAGLSQRQLCGQTVTRNMLSLIENGAARPSMDTLSYFARQLGKPISYFLDETAVVSPNAQVMAAARDAFAARDHAQALAQLNGYRTPDPVFDHEKSLLEALCCLALAEAAMAEDRLPYARQLLERIDVTGPYFTAPLQRQRQLMLGILPTPDDAELLLRAESALNENQYSRALHYLAAAEDHDTQRWALLCGRAHFAMKQYAEAAPHLEKATPAAPKLCLSALEVCYRELSDFENAYRCACKLRDL